MHRTGFIAFVSILFFTLTLGQVCEDGGAEYGHGCLNNGVCELDPHDSTLYCSCQVDFTGDYCETEMLVCSDSVPCLNGGVCIESEAGNECNCAEGYTGYLCETEFDCESNDDCFNGGTCDDETNRCTCLSGVTGYHCERVFPTCNCSDTIECVNDVICPCCCEGEACVPEPVCEVDIEIGHGCLNGGVCTSDVDPTEFDYCQCPDGYTGDYCETEMLVCGPTLDCMNGGTCLEDDGGEKYCNCPDGYSGYLCETETDCSSDDDCLNGGTCDGTRCVCLSGVTGYHCERIFPTCDCIDGIECVGDVCPCCCEGEECVDLTDPDPAESDDGACILPSIVTSLLLVAFVVYSAR